MSVSTAQAQMILRPKSIGESIGAKAPQGGAIEHKKVEPVRKARKKAPQATAKATPAPAEEPQVVRIYSNPNTTIEQSMLLYDDFEGLDVCFPSAFHSTADTEKALDLIFNGNDGSPLAQILYKNFDYTDAIHDIPTLVAVYEAMFPGIAISHTDTSLTAEYADAATHFFSKAFTHDGHLCISQVLYAEPVAPAMSSFIPILVNNFHSR